MMKTSRLLASLLIPALAMLARLAAQDHHNPRNWEMRDGSKMTGSFVKMLDDKLIIKDKNKEIPILHKWLSPKSLEEARAIDKGRKEKAVDAARLMEFTYVYADKERFPSSTFDMGAPQKDTALQQNEPYHPVQMTRGFFIKQTEVTWAEWNTVRDWARDNGYTDLATGRKGSDDEATDNHPVTEISWWDAVKWCNAKSQIENETAVYYTSPDFKPDHILTTGTPVLHVNWEASGYRLPTEAEWELAWHCGGRVQDKKVPEPDGWHNGISANHTHPVRSMASATQKSIHDMLGNVAEWCWDWKGPLVKRDHEINPRGPETGSHRVFRGGSWADPEYCCRPTYRGDFSPVTPRSRFIGFRPARNASK